MVDPVRENIVLVEHVLSFICTIITIYFSNNFNIQFLASMSMIQHFIKIVRIMVYGFELKGSPLWFCRVHAFVNHFSNNILVIITCIIILNLYVALKYPNYFVRYNKKMRPFVVIFSTIYTAIFTLGAFYEPFTKYTEEDVASKHNCSTAYRDKFYQYLLASPLTDIEFIIVSVYCTIYIIYKIIITPKIKIRRHISASTKISLSKWIMILSICGAITLISLLNIKNDIRDAFKAKEGIPEVDYLEGTYYITASSGILIMLFFITPNQVKYKFGMSVKETSNHCFEYKLSTTNNNTFRDISSYDDNYDKYDRDYYINMNSNMGMPYRNSDLYSSNLHSKSKDNDHQKESKNTNNNSILEVNGNPKEKSSVTFTHPAVHYSPKIYYYFNGRMNISYDNSLAIRDDDDDFKSYSNYSHRYGNNNNNNSFLLKPQNSYFKK